MKINKIDYYNLIFIITIVALYLLNNNRKDPINLVVLNSLLAFFSLLFVALLPKCIQSLRRKNFSILDFTLLYIVVSSVLLTFLFRQFVNVHFIYLIIATVVIKSHLTIRRPLLRFIVVVVLISILIQLMVFRANDGRVVLSYFDPNYSAMMIFLFGAFVHYSFSKKLALFIFSLGLITLSRNYILVIVIFYLCIYLNSNRFFHKIFRFLVRPEVVLLTITGLPLLINVVFLANFDVNNTVVLTSENKLTGGIADRSNFDRSLANILFIQDLINYPGKYMFGIDTKNYTETIFRNTPHHSFFQLIINYGLLFSIPYIFVFLRLAHSSCNLEPSKIPFYISCFMYMMILGGLIYGITLIFLCFILKVNNCSERNHIQVF